MADSRAPLGEGSPSKKFGELEGQRVYRALVEDDPHYADKGVGEVAARAVLLAKMVDEPRFDVDKDIAAGALIAQLDSEVPAAKGVSLNGE